MPLPAIKPTGVFSAWITPVDSSAGGGVTAALGADPGDTNAPIIFEPFWTLSGGVPSIWIIASGGVNWGGAQVYVSLDSTTYTQIGSLVQGANQGVLSATFASGADPDTVNTLSVDLTESDGSIIAGTSADADFKLPTLAYCDGELVAFSAATLTAPNAYDLDTYIRRGCYSTAIASHAIGTQFAWIQGPFSYDYPPPLIGSTIYFKFPSFNTLGGELQDPAGCTAYPYTLTGVGLRPLAELTIVSKTTDYTILPTDNGTHYDNCGAVANVTLTLPAAASGLTFSFLVCEAFYVKVLAIGSDVISRGSGDDSAAAGYIRSNLPSSFITIESHEAGRWIVTTQTGDWSIDV